MPDSPIPASSAQCDECGAPVADEQRYCVACGAHRKHVNDPAARYLSQASARSRVTRAARTARRVPASASGSRGLGIAVALALIPAAAAAGVLAGRSSGNGDSKVIAALGREQAALGRANASASTATTVASTGSSGASSGTTAGRSGSHHSTSTRTGGHARHHAASHTHHHQLSGATPVSSAPPSAAAKATGAKVTQKVQKSTGKSYVNGQSNLPGTVVVP